LRFNETKPTSLRAGPFRRGDRTMRNLEAVASSLVALAAQALVVGVVVTTL
jgi:hypothetical protein